MGQTLSIILPLLVNTREIVADNLSVVIPIGVFEKWLITGADAHTTDPADAQDTGEGGDGKLVFPIVGALVAGTIASGFGSGAYSVYRSYMGGRENSRYWADYQRNTGVTPRYRYRSGYSYDYGRMLGGISQGFGASASAYGLYSYHRGYVPAPEQPYPSMDYMYG